MRWSCVQDTIRDEQKLLWNEIEWTKIARKNETKHDNNDHRHKIHKIYSAHNGTKRYMFDYQSISNQRQYNCSNKKSENNCHGNKISEKWLTWLIVKIARIRKNLRSFEMLNNNKIVLFETTIIDFWFCIEIMTRFLTSNGLWSRRLQISSVTITTEIECDHHGLKNNLRIRLKNLYKTICVPNLGLIFENWW